MTTPADERLSAFSPDGRWIAYTSDETGTYEVFVRPYPGPGGRWQISSGGGVYPIWSPDGRRLFYRVDRDLYVTDVDADDDNVFRAGASRVLLDDLRLIELGTGYGIAPDGQAIIDTDPAEKEVAPDQATVMVSWSTSSNDWHPAKKGTCTKRGFRGQESSCRRSGNCPRNPLFVHVPVASAILSR